mmetsp:Transcript_14789/g.34708  ORF Transcript_14789/g.34708 Transcript_14789/m.34708 type:complete len:217 (-) Transcript_14789:3727-4377(-)
MTPSNIWLQLDTEFHTSDRRSMAAGARVSVAYFCCVFGVLLKNKSVGGGGFARCKAFACLADGQLGQDFVWKAELLHGHVLGELVNRLDIGDLVPELGGQEGLEEERQRLEREVRMQHIQRLDVLLETAGQLVVGSLHPVKLRAVLGLAVCIAVQHGVAVSGDLIDKRHQVHQQFFHLLGVGRGGDLGANNDEGALARVVLASKVSEPKGLHLMES